jgi:hypothetical protein
MTPDDPLAQFQAFKQQLAARFGIQIPSAGGQQVSGPAMSGSTQADRFQQEAGRGTAPFTGHNLLAAGQNAMGLVGGFGPVSTGISSMAEQGLGLDPGTLGGIQNMQGFRAIPPENRRLVGNLVDLQHAQYAAQHGGEAYGGGGRGAVDSHGQVRGGGTGSAGGGLTQGGPR